MSDDHQGRPEADVPERPGGTRAFMEALSVRRNAAIGFGLGIGGAAGLLVAVALASGAETYPLAYYGGLSFVLATGLGLLLTILLTLGSLFALLRRLE